MTTRAPCASHLRSAIVPFDSPPYSSLLLPQLPTDGAFDRLAGQFQPRVRILRDADSRNGRAVANNFGVVRAREPPPRPPPRPPICATLSDRLVTGVVDGRICSLRRSRPSHPMRACPGHRPSCSRKGSRRKRRVAGAPQVQVVQRTRRREGRHDMVRVVPCDVSVRARSEWGGAITRAPSPETGEMEEVMEEGHALACVRSSGCTSRGPERACEVQSGQSAE